MLSINRTLPLLVALIISINAGADNNKPTAEETPPTQETTKQGQSVNYCHNPVETKKWEGMRLKYPADVGILHLYALRVGLCKLIDDKKIGLETAIDVFNVEHQKLIKERLQQKDPNRQLTI